MKAIVSEKGQVTIPKRLRDELGIRPGQVLEFEREGARLIAEKKTTDDPVAKVRGILGSGRSTDQFMALIRPGAEA